MNAMAAAHDQFGSFAMRIFTGGLANCRDGGASAPDGQSILDIQGIVLTMFDARNNLAQQVVNDVRTHLGKKSIIR